jgi:hypothetical protein
MGQDELTSTTYRGLINGLEAGLEDISVSVSEEVSSGSTYDEMCCGVEWYMYGRIPMMDFE